MRYLYAGIALSLLVALHELGHVVAARLLGVRVQRFSFGIGPPIFSFTWRGIEWAVGAIPFGGLAVIHGDSPHQPIAHDDRQALTAQSAWRRIAVLAAGPVVNYALAWIVLFALYVAGTHVPVRMTIGTVVPGSEAARAQLRPGDLIVTFNGEPADDWGELVARVGASPGRPIRLGIVRHGEPRLVDVTPRASGGGEGRIGIGRQYVFKQHGPLDAAGQAALHTGRVIVDGFALVWRWLGGREATPSGFVKEASDAASAGWDAFLRVFASLSVALALLYAMPLPSLDGGRIAFAAIEALRKKPVDRRVETAIHAAFYVAVLTAAALYVRAILTLPRGE